LAPTVRLRPKALRATAAPAPAFRKFRRVDEWGMSDILSGFKKSDVAKWL
jgi:hypothetical protein